MLLVVCGTLECVRVIRKGAHVTDGMWHEWYRAGFLPSLAQLEKKTASTMMYRGPFTVGGKTVISMRS